MNDTASRPVIHRDGTVSVDGTTVGSIRRRLRPGAPGQSWRVEWEAYDDFGSLLTVQSARRLAVESVVLRYQTVTRRGQS